MKPKRKSDKKLLAEVRSQPCWVCGRAAPSDASHIKTKGSGGPDEPWNVVPKCRQHHIEWGMGWSKFLDKYPNFKLRLKFLGWEWENGRLFHPSLGVIEN